MKTTATTLTAVVGLILATAAPAAAQTGGKRDILQVLTDIGCRVTESADGKNSKIHYAEYTRNGRTYFLRACLSPDNSRVWVSLPLKKIDPAAAAANGEALYKLLQLNQDTGPRHFKIQNDMLYLSGAVENRDISNYHVRQLIEALITDLENTRRTWDRDWTRPALVSAYGRGN
jgi:hypothetical protein